ncbi:MAG: aspartate dehydrogenase [Lachnospiraceae bacterium]|nr:aspartate dehydrogenase [Lachnospiraceae bacterium]MBP1585517.1 aspartate dehydrogenase [Lachnospiraceae bacterium]
MIILCIAVAFFVWFFTKKKYEKKDDSVKYEYDPEKEKPIIRASICNGEQVAGFKNKETGEFHEIMMIRDQSELNEFMKTYGLDHVDKEY